MSDPYLGEIRLVGFTFAPVGWALCNGQIMSISQNSALFSLLGTTYGGNGTSTFALPNLQGRVAMHFGQSPGTSNYVQGQVSGTENTTLLTSNLPQHNHGLVETNAKAAMLARTEAPNAAFPNGNFLGGSNIYVSGQTAGNAALSGSAIKFGIGAVTELTGSNIPINNLQPYLVLNYIIALNGIFPSRN